MIYCTMYCNFGHDMETGEPVDHKCYDLPPAALKAEMEGDFDRAIKLFQKGKKMKFTPIEKIEVPPEVEKPCIGCEVLIKVHPQDHTPMCDDCQELAFGSF